MRTCKSPARIRRLIFAAALASLVAVACDVAREPPAASHLAELDAWKASREESLRREDGWLTLVGLSWLEEGENSLGSNPTSDVLFPVGTGRVLGEIELDAGALLLKAEPGEGIFHRGEPVETLALTTDAQGDPTILDLDSLTFHIIDRAGRYGVRIKDSDAQALREFSGMEYFPVDPSWRVEATLTPYAEPRTMSVPNVIGTAFDEPVPGVLSFEFGGKRFELTPVGEAGDELFIVFGDATNGSETYGGGRFLYADPPASDGRVVLDFNRAYNPPCVFTPFATCPLPPPENQLPLAVRAGELAFGAAH